MGKFTYAQNNFVSGELSPKLEGRNDLKEYYNGLKTMENFLPMREGGALLRPPTEFIKNISSDTAPQGALYPFIVSRTESYVVAIDSKNNDSLEVYRTGNSAYGGTLTSVYDKTDMFAWVKTEFSGLDNDGYRYVQINNVMILTHVSGNMHPLVLQRLSANTFYLDTYYRIVNGAYTSSIATAVNSTGTTIRGVVWKEENKVHTQTMTVTGGPSYTITCSVSGVFQALMARKASSSPDTYIRIRDTTASPVVEGIYFLGTENVASNQFTACGLVAGTAVALSTAFPQWSISSWNQYDGHPKAISLFQRRLHFGGTFTEPNTFWASRVENLYLLCNRALTQDASSDTTGLGFAGTETTAETRPFEVVIASDQTNSIKWMSSDRSLQLGTAAGEYVVAGTQGTYGPSNIDVRALTFFGSSDAEAIRAHNATYFIGTDGKMVREVGFSEEQGSNISRLLTVLSDQLVYHGLDKTTASVFDTRFTTMAWQASRSILWLLTNSGNLVGATLEPASNILAWHKHTISGTSVVIKGICVIPDDLGRYDMVYLNVQRTVNVAGVATTVRYIERLGESLPLDNVFGNYNAGRDYLHHSDSSFAPSVQTLGGTKWDVTHLEGETVEVICKGVSEGQKTVGLESGTAYVEVTNADAAAGNILVGLPFKGTLESMVLEAGSRTGNAFIQLKSIDTILLKILRGLKYKVGTSSSNLIARNLTNSSSPLALYTGNDQERVESTPDEAQRFYIESDGPYPLAILSVAVRGVTQD